MRFVRFVFKNLIDIYLHANYLFVFLNTNYTNMLLENEKNRKFLKIREIREIRVGKFNIPHSALKDSITNLSKLAL